MQSLASRVGEMIAQAVSYGMTYASDVLSALPTVVEGLPWWAWVTLAGGVIGLAVVFLVLKRRKKRRIARIRRSLWERR